MVKGLRIALLFGRELANPRYNYFLSSWMCIYPCYIDGTKTVAEGRRVAKSKACIKQPWAKDIVEALKELRFSQAFEVTNAPADQVCIPIESFL